MISGHFFCGKHLPLKLLPFSKREGFATVSFHMFGCNPLQISGDTRFAFPVFPKWNHGYVFFNGMSFYFRHGSGCENPVKVRFFLAEMKWKGIGYLKQQHITWLFRFFQWNCFSSGWFQVSTYLFVRCSNHKCVQHLCEEVTLTWLLLDYLVWRFVFVWTSRSWLILVQVPSLYLRFEIFHPTPPYLHFIHDLLSSHVYPSCILCILCTKEPPSVLPTRIDSCPPFSIFSVWRVIWFPYPVVTVEPIHIKIYHLIEDQIFELRFLKRILSPWEDSNTLDGGHEPKIQPIS